MGSVAIGNSFKVIPNSISSALILKFKFLQGNHKKPSEVSEEKNKINIDILESKYL